MNLPPDDELLPRARGTGTSASERGGGTPSTGKPKPENRFSVFRTRERCAGEQPKNSPWNSARDSTLAEFQSLADGRETEWPFGHEEDHATTLPGSGSRPLHLGFSTRSSTDVGRRAGGAEPCELPHPVGLGARASAEHQNTTKTSQDQRTQDGEATGRSCAGGSGCLVVCFLVAGIGAAAIIFFLANGPLARSQGAVSGGSGRTRNTILVEDLEGVTIMGVRVPKAHLGLLESLYDEYGISSSSCADEAGGGGGCTTNPDATTVVLLPSRVGGAERRDLGLSLFWHAKGLLRLRGGHSGAQVGGGSGGGQHPRAHDRAAGVQVVVSGHSEGAGGGFDGEAFFRLRGLDGSGGDEVVR